jgi:cell wall-associated NlpC family hydrolase
MTLNQAQRESVIRAAVSWLRTPYHHRAAVKGAGADCAFFPVAVYKECGILPGAYEPPEYSSQWHLHRSEELYLAEIERFCSELRPEAEAADVHPQPADFMVMQFGRTFSHGAIVVNWPIVIHSYIPHGVTLTDVQRDGQTVGRKFKVYQVMLDKIAAWRRSDRTPWEKSCAVLDAARETSSADF